VIVEVVYLFGSGSVERVFDEVVDTVEISLNIDPLERDLAMLGELWTVERQREDRQSDKGYKRSIPSCRWRLLNYSGSKKMED
jgi:hypothetical protein